MLNNYLKIALRNLQRQKAYTLINVLGLALGFACAILIFSFVKYHLGFDAFHSKKDRIYRIVTEDHMEKVFYYPGTPPPVGKAFRNDYTFAEKVSRVYVMDWQLISLPFTPENQKFQEEPGVAFAEPGFFDILDFGVEIFILAIFLTLIITCLTVGYSSLKAALMNPVKSLKSE